MAEPEKKRGRPESGGKGKKISKLRRIANRLEQMARTQAMNIVQQSLDGEEVDKDKLATAKWTVTTAQAMHKACLQEEEILNEDTTHVAADEVEGADEKGTAAVFSLVRTK